MGISRSKVVHRDTYPQIKKSGLSIPNVTCILSSESIPADYPKISDAGYPDVFIIPEADTWHLCPWSGSKSGRKIAQVFGEMHQKDKNSTPCGFDPRVVCKKLLGSLEKEFGLSLYSALEYEFAMAKDGKPVTSKMHIYSPVGLKATEDFCFEVSDRLEKAGVLLETIMHEHGQGQLELTMKPYWGIKAADHALMYKQCVKETAIDLGFRATFMCNPWLAVQSGGHYNFSLWNKSGTNVFTDDSDSDGLSDLAKNWIAGVLEHAPAITALVCHTNNCYNRFYEGGFAPYHICYAEENRSSLVRVKRSESSGTYLEYRGGGAAANPYLVLSAVLAAGIDGLRKNLTVSSVQIANKSHENLKTETRYNTTNRSVFFMIFSKLII